MYAAIDGDGFIYAAASAVQSRWYEVNGHKFDGQTGLLEARAFCDDQRPMIPHQYIENKTEAEPAAHAIHSLNCMIKRLKADLADEGVTEMEIFIGHSDSYKNFRFNHNPQYKANRPPKPIRFKEVRDAMVKRHGATISAPDLETDDEVAIAALENNGIIVSVDKDFNQIPAPRWDWKKREWANVLETPQWHDYELCKQLLTGDATDNIKTGLYKFGPHDVAVVHDMRLRKFSLAKIAKELGCGTTAVKQMLKLEVTDSYGNIGPAFADKLLSKFDNPHHAVLHQYHKCFSIHADENLKRVGNQIYLLRDLDDSFDNYFEENFNAEV